MNNQSLGTMIRALRTERGMTQLDLARQMGVTDKAVSNWERDLSIPDVSSLPRLAGLLGVSVEELLQAKDVAREGGTWPTTARRMNLPRFRLHPYAAFRAAPSRCLAPDSAGLRLPGAEWIPTLLQKASMYPKISSDARSRVSKVPACAYSALMGPMSDSMAALSQGGEMEPIEGSMPASRMVPPSSSEAYRLPWSLRCTQPFPGRLLAIAVFSASSASPAPMRSDIDQPTTILDHMSMTTAG